MVGGVAGIYLNNKWENERKIYILKTIKFSDNRKMGFVFVERGYRSRTCKE